MKRRVLSLFMAAMSVAMFCIFYPEYILLPDTYDYIAEESSQVPCENSGQGSTEDWTNLMYAKPDLIRVTSKILQMMEKEGIVIWKNKN